MFPCVKKMRNVTMLGTVTPTAADVGVYPDGKG